jgi:acyl-[acyl-carrier-protein]-phospholipid O-acyltransferase/long-chain-fatty-acid--[acyl-carrier-protein] ligase
MPSAGQSLLEWLRPGARGLLRLLFRVRVHGLEHYRRAGPRLLIVANHVSYLDAVLLALFLPDRLTFAVDPRIAARWWVRPLLVFVDVVLIDPAQPMAAKALVRLLEGEHRVVIFPEGRISRTGSLAKIYPGPAFVADRAATPVLPIRIAGAERSRFAPADSGRRRRWFPRVTLTVLPARRLAVERGLRGAARRHAATRQLADVMAEMMLETSDWRCTIPAALLAARAVHGGRHVIVEDTDRTPLRYDQLLARAVGLADLLRRRTRPGERVGIALPGSVGAVLALLALQLAGRVPAMLNFTRGAAGMETACRVAGVVTVCTSRRFAAAARLQPDFDALAAHARVIYLEDLRAEATLAVRLAGAVRARLMAWTGRPPHRGTPDEPAVVLFTSGTEGRPKAVVLSHANLLANQAQILVRLDAGPGDVMLDTLPLFHAFGLTVGALLPLLSGIRVFLYPSPLHYRVVPEVAYDIGATLMFGTDTFLAGYGRRAHPYDFHRIRYVFAGAEPLDPATRRAWAERFGVRILEGYGATETAPVLAVDTPMEPRPGTVGRFLPGVEHALEPVPGLDRGGRLSVRGPNVMLGYLDAHGRIAPPRTERGDGWYDTGDIVEVDGDGFVTIRGRARRFAKVAGEMVSLAAVEELAARAWPGARHAAVRRPDPRKGERIVLVTDRHGARRADLARQAAEDGTSELHVPAQVLTVDEIPLLPLGKPDYGRVEPMVERTGEAARAPEAERRSA